MTDPETAAGSAERQLFVRALEKPAGKERAAFLDGACGDSPELRRRLEALLEKFESLGTFLEQPAVSASGAPSEPQDHQPAPEPLQETAGLGGPSERPGDRIGRYKLLQKIGEGGCGIVYMAEQEEPVRRRVALKVTKLGMDTRQVIARFEAERQALALMDHPNIAKVLDAGATETGRPYFVMELVRGIKITEYCDQNNLPTRQRLELFIQICRAIQHAHQKGIIHRDIKPSNILVTLHDGIPIPKVIDFGIAKATTDQRLTDKTLFTQFEQFIGTPAYMSPEQAEMGGMDIDTRTDIYSLGVLLYELLTGKTPFDSKELMAAGLDEMRRTIREREPVRPSTRLSTLLEGELTTTAKRRACEAPKLIHMLRGDLDWIVMKCLEKDRTRRYETANGLAIDLNRHLNNEPVTARPPGRLYQFQKLVRRNKLAFASATAIALALVLGTIVSTWQAARATKASKAASINAQKANQAETKESAARAAAEQSLYESLVREARATRIARRPGYRQRVFELVSRARSLRHDSGDPSDLRCEVSQCLGDFVALNSTLLRDFPADIAMTALDPHGRLAAFGLENSTVLLVQVPSGEIVAQLTCEPGSNSAGWVKGLCFSPSGEQLLTVQYTNRVFKWTQSANGRWQEVAQKDTIPGVFACLSTAKDVFLVADNQAAHLVELLDPDSKAVTRSIPYSEEISGELVVALSRDGRFMAIGGASSSNGVAIQIWDLPGGKSVQRREPMLADLFSLNFSDDGEYLSCLSNSGGRIYARLGWQPIVDVRDQFDFYEPGGIVFTPQDPIAAWPAIMQNAVRLFHCARNEELAFLKEPRRAEQVAFAANGNLLLTSGGRQARLYQLQTPEKLTLPGHTSGVNDVAFNPKNSNLASVGKDKMVRVWDSAKDRLLWADELPGQGQSIAYSPDGNLLAAGVLVDSGVQQQRSVFIWDANTGTRLSQLETTRWCVWSVQFSPNGQYLVADGEPGGVRVWELKRPGDGAVEATLVKSFTGNCWGLAFSRDSRRLVFVNKFTDHHEVNLWDLDTTAQPYVIATNLSSDGGLAFTPEGLLLNTDTHRAIVTLNPLNGKELSRFMTETISPEELADAGRPRYWGGTPGFSLSPDGKKLAVSPVSRTTGVDIWDPNHPRLLYSLPEENGSVWSLAWSPDGRQLAISRSNGDISIWTLPEVERVLASLGLSP